MHYAILYNTMHQQYEVKVDFNKPVDLTGSQAAGSDVLFAEKCPDDGFDALFDYIKEINTNSKKFNPRELEKRLKEKISQA